MQGERSAARTAAAAAAAGMLVAGTYVALLWKMQGRVLYQARQYGSYDMGPMYEEAKRRCGSELRRVPVPDARGREQVAWVVQGDPKGKLWAVFGGNAMLALDWLPVVGELHAEEQRRGFGRSTFLLIDYCGYGESQGEPERGPIVDAAQATLEREIGSGDYSSLGFLGCSLGCAVALATAQRFMASPLPLDACVLACPFTSIWEVGKAHRFVPPFLPDSLESRLVRDGCRWNNKTALSTLLDSAAAASRPLAVHFLHGAADEICPIGMGRRLHALARDKQAQHGAALVRTTFAEIPGVDHNSLLDLGFESLVDAVLDSRTGPSAATSQL